MTDLTPAATAADIRAMMAHDRYNRFLDRLAAALEVGEGYVIISLDPEGLRVTPVRCSSADDTVIWRSGLRAYARSVEELGEGSFVASTQDEREGTLPPSETSSTPAPHLP